MSLRKKYGGRGFYLEVPLYIEPLRLTYQVGDTMNIRMELTDEVRDLSRDAVFKIENFPFKPSHELYRIDDNSWETGYNGNELYVDSIYNPSLIQESSGWSVNVRGVPTYEAGVYFMEHQLVLREPGRYVHLVGDVIETIDGHLIAEGRIPEYAAVSNDSGCPTPHTYDVAYVLNWYFSIEKSSLIGSAILKMVMSISGQMEVVAVGFPPVGLEFLVLRL